MSYPVQRTETLAPQEPSVIRWFAVRGYRTAELSDDLTQVERVSLLPTVTLHMFDDDDRQAMRDIDLDELDALIEALQQARAVVVEDQQRQAYQRALTGD